MEEFDIRKGRHAVVWDRRRNCCDDGASIHGRVAFFSVGLWLHIL